MVVFENAFNTPSHPPKIRYTSERRASQENIRIALAAKQIELYIPVEKGVPCSLPYNVILISR
jgi:hypothetical protein